jgi:IclR family KDG regulon transcriptional repressor
MNTMDLYIPSVHSALRILELLSKEQYKSCTLSEISKSLSINKTTCLRILKTLQIQDFVQFDESVKRYSLGTYLIVLGDRAKEVNDVIRLAKSFMPQLCKEIGQTIVLAKHAGNHQLMYIAKEEPNESIRLTISVGETFPIFSGALGKTYMAFLDEKEAMEIINEVIVDGELPRYTNYSITDLDVYMENLRTIREKGIAESFEEYTPGIAGLGCPIFNSKGKIVLILGAFRSSITNYFDNQTSRKLLQKCAQEITQAISNF